MPKRDPGALFKDILGEIKKIEEFTEGVDQDKFYGEAKTQYAVIRGLEIIGEAVRNLPKEVKDKYPGVEWKKISGLRDILIHQYFGIDPSILWNIVQTHLPVFKQKVQKLLDKESAKEE